MSFSCSCNRLSRYKTVTTSRPFTKTGSLASAWRDAMAGGGERLPQAGRVLLVVALLLHLCAGSAAGAASSCSALQTRLRGGEGLLDKADRVVTEYLFR